MAALTYVNQIGAVEGMNQAAPGTLIPESFVRFSQDVLFDRAGLMRRRGPFSSFTTYSGTNIVHDYYAPGSNEIVIGVFSTYDPNGAPRVGMIVNSTVGSTITTIFRVFDNQFKFLGEEILLDGASDSVEALCVVSARPALGGGLWITLAGSLESASQQYQFFWRGGAGTATSNGTFALAPLQTGFSGDSRTLDKSISSVTTTSVTVGMHAYVTGKYIGVVKTVNTTSIVLEKYPFVWNTSVLTNDGVLVGATHISSLVGAIEIKFYSTRPYEHFHGRGLLSILSATPTTAIGGVVGTSAELHSLSAKLTASNAYRASDNHYLGKILSVQDNTNITFNATTRAIMEADEYVTRDPAITTSFAVTPSSVVANRVATSFAGLYTAVYAGYQWYGSFGKDDANTNRVVFSASHNGEAVDLSPDAADSIIFPGKSAFRGLGASSAGLLVFLEDKVYILRGNERNNFSVEQLVPEGCICASSIVEYGGGVFWAGKTGIMFFDGASVRNLTKDTLGLYYSDSLHGFNPEVDRVIGFMHNNNLVMHYTNWVSPFDPIRYEPVYAADWLTTDGIADRAWEDFDADFDYDDFFTENNTPIYWDLKTLNNPEESASLGLGFKWDDGVFKWKEDATVGNIYKWGPLRLNTSITWSLYMPTNAITTLSNMDFRGSTSIESTNGLETILGVNSIEGDDRELKRGRFIDIHGVYDTHTNGKDALLVEKINIPVADLVHGPDFYLQTKHFTVGDPILRKWFKRILVNMLLYDGAIRMDLIDDDDNDSVDINKKKHQYWEIFTERGYDWTYLTDIVFPKLVSPNKASWINVEDSITYWSELFTADFNRYVKRVSWRKSSIGLRFYQLNEYRKPFNGVVTLPTRAEIQGFSVGYKVLRPGRQ